MKTNLLLLTTLFTFAISNAQLKEKGSIEFTPKIGYSSFSELTTAVANPNGGSTQGVTGSTTGFSFGGTLDYYFNNRWSFRSGFNFDKMGAVTNLNGIKYEDKFNYLSIPINANWHFGSTRKWNLNFGLSPSFLTSAYFVKNNSESVAPNNILNSFQIGMSYGIGYKIEINKKFGILIESQNFYGLSNVSKVSTIDFKNIGGSFNLGAVIQL